MFENNIQDLLENGLKFFNKNNFVEAEKIYKKILEIDKENAEAYCGLGTINAIRKKYNDAINYLSITIKLQPQNYFAYNNIGTIYYDLENFNKAIEYFNKAISINADYLNSLNMRALSHERLNDLNSAIKDYQIIKKKFPDDSFIDGIILLTKAKLCSWDSFGYELNKIKNKIINKKLSWEPFTSLILGDSIEIQSKTLELYTKKMAVHFDSNFNYKKKKKEKIKIGYFSSDFRNHAVSFLISRTLELHNKNEFTICGFSFYKNIIKDKMRERLIKSFDFFFDLDGMTDVEILNFVRSHEIDIAIDLNGYTDKNKFNIFFNRVAPIQINFLGYPGSMGFETMDYIIADKILIPDNEKKFYKEKIIYMPGTYQPNDDTLEISKKIFTRAELKLPENSFIFACFNSIHKITPKIYLTWINILKKIDNSVLWILYSNNRAKNNLIKEFKKNSLSENRLIFAEKIEHSLHLSRLKVVDLCLDTIPYNGHTTTSDALRAGLPVVTCMGNTFAGKVASSLLNACKMKELITHDLNEYENLAIQLALNKEKLNSLKKKIINNKDSVLFNSKLFTKNLENAYKNVYEIYNSDLKKRDIYIN
jgi:predicted O-linked N-acetylglucosamine transferase (SPINDLY family)